jgi:hypothetical protein
MMPRIVRKGFKRLTKGTRRPSSPNPYVERERLRELAEARDKRIAAIRRKPPRGYIASGTILDDDRELCVLFFKKGRQEKLVKV